MVAANDTGIPPVGHRNELLTLQVSSTNRFAVHSMEKEKSSSGFLVAKNVMNEVVIELVPSSVVGSKEGPMSLREFIHQPSFVNRITEDGKLGLAANDIDCAPTEPNQQKG